MIHHTRPGEKFFVPYRVRLLKAIKDENMGIGSTVMAEDVPNRTVHLLNKSNQIMKSNAREGVDFKKI